MPDRYIKEVQRLLKLKSEEIGITPKELLLELSPSGKVLTEKVLIDKLKVRCSCRTVGKDDGNHTCFEHHNCGDGSCTHTDGDDQ